MLVKILTGLAVVIAGLAAFIMTRPDTYRYERSTTIKAPASAIFPFVNDLRKWEQWSPWVKSDPNAEIRFNGPATGTGSSFYWKGNPNAGEGTMMITDSVENEKAVYRLDFLKPMPGTAMSEITLKEQGPDTLVTWSMYGKNNFIGKAMSLFFNCEKMINEKYDEGLAKMKALFETGKPRF